MLLAAAHGLIKPLPDFAMYSDLKAEGAEVAEHVRFMQGGNVLPFPVRVVDGGDLLERTRKAAARELRNVVPFYTPPTRRRDRGQLVRGCTRDFKIRPLDRELRRALGYGPRQRIPAGVVVEQWIGIGAEELVRATPSGHSWIVNRWPLLELGWKRHDCERFLRDVGFPIPPKSRCVFCPYTSDARWAAIKAAGGEEWRTAVEVDRSIREGFLGSKTGAYVHSSLKPLEEVEFTDSTADLLGHECGGRCGT